MDNKHTQTERGGPKDGQPQDSRQMDKPEWADSLRNLYDSVVDEPIPDSFKDLLSKLDESGKDGGTA